MRMLEIPAGLVIHARVSLPCGGITNRYAMRDGTELRDAVGAALPGRVVSWEPATVDVAADFREMRGMP